MRQRSQDLTAARWRHSPGAMPRWPSRPAASPYAMIESTRMMFERLGHSRGNAGEFTRPWCGT